MSATLATSGCETRCSPTCQGRFSFDELVQTYSLDEINTAFADSESGRVVKPVVVF
ncbi:hypothetical protein LY13_001512 [Prauserella aidingensis]|uniref:hypothetical protein n=1 Tax=Prauserella aidingensis TaxID=387890 RepID=UPI0020A53ED7|nr:hypothetical protein [Prauserella aidingensis]MCP2252769.1 hypothetical protein [Prauserella aidingensis]